MDKIFIQLRSMYNLTYLFMPLFSVLVTFTDACITPSLSSYQGRHKKKLISMTKFEK